MARVRRAGAAEAEGLPLPHVVRRGRAARARGRRADLRRAGRQGQDDHAGQGQTGRADVEIQLRSRYAPLPSDARAILRQKTLLGETYVELTPGHNSAKPIPEGGELPASQVSDTVELDEILRAFDPKTRAAFQDWMQTQAQAISGQGRDLNDALGNLAPFAEDTADIVSILNQQEGAVSRLIANTGIVFGALTERDGQLRSLIENSNTVFATTAERDTELQAAFRALPTFEKESKLTFERLTSSPTRPTR